VGFPNNYNMLWYQWRRGHGFCTFTRQRGYVWQEREYELSPFEASRLCHIVFSGKTLSVVPGMTGWHINAKRDTACTEA
jgi:hypothetical protein